MARKSNNKENDKESRENIEFNFGAKFWNDIKRETLQAVLSIISFLLALLSILAAFSKAGPVGYYMYGEHGIFSYLLGVGYFLLPVFFIMLSISFLKGIQKSFFDLPRLIGSFLFFLSGIGIIDILPGRHGGIVGHIVSTPLLRLFDIYATTSLLIAGIIIAILVMFNTHFTLENLMFWKRFKKDDAELKSETKEAKIEASIKAVEDKIKEDEKRAEKIPEKTADVKEKKAKIKIQKPEEEGSIEDGNFASYANPLNTKPFVPPPLSLLETDKGKPETGDIKARANIIQRTLSNFGITVEMDEISIGPSVTRYALKPAEGVKLSKIVALNNDLALALAAHPIRIEAPIPGKSLVGIEIPNSTKTTVGLATLLANEEYQKSDKPLLVSLGKGVTGKSYFANLAKAPHMLIAGTTGSGKSVTIHAVITSLLYRNSPENLKFIMIDPKRVELTLYNDIPHLLTPVITDPKKSILALKWAAKEMSRRYDILEKNKIRDIASYHTNVLQPVMEKIAAGKEVKRDDIPETMPYIVIIIDELADIMQTYPRELESAIVRLAQMSRAIGIHLIISTQRPSVNVITGLIKANIPTRVALQVSSQIDSRTILDTVGAEKLLGAGDMLYLGGEMAKPARLQSAYISETEVKKVVKHLVNEYKDEVMGEINLTSNAIVEPGKDAVFSAEIGGDEDLGEEDDMLEAAKEAVISAGKASTSYLQRKLGVGYSRAAKLMDTLEEKGIIGPQNGSKPREIIGIGAGNGGNAENESLAMTPPGSEESENTNV
jgi:S-DNA-T family DNA segregation ATPase FtsK/SpoIIIE